MTDKTDTTPPAEKPAAAPRARRGGCLWIVLGLLLLGVGIPMLVLPGPGIAAVLGGLGLIVKGVRPRRDDA